MQSTNVYTTLLYPLSGAFSTLSYDMGPLLQQDCLGNVQYKAPEDHLKLCIRQSHGQKEHQGPSCVDNVIF